MIERNLVVGLQRLVADRIGEGRCPDARRLIAEGRALAPNDSQFQLATATCGPGP